MGEQVVMWWEGLPQSLNRVNWSAAPLAPLVFTALLSSKYLVLIKAHMLATRYKAFSLASKRIVKRYILSWKNMLEYFDWKLKSFRIILLILLIVLGLCLCMIRYYWKKRRRSASGLIEVKSYKIMNIKKLIDLEAQTLHPRPSFIWS